MSQSASFELARPGDLQAFNRLVAPYEDLVYGQAFYLLAQPGLAEVAAEAAFRLANRDLGSYRGSEAALKLGLLGLVTDLRQLQWAERGVRALRPKDDRSPSSGPSGAPKSGDMNGRAWDGLRRHAITHDASSERPERHASLEVPHKEAVQFSRWSRNLRS